MINLNRGPYDTGLLHGNGSILARLLTNINGMSTQSLLNARITTGNLRNRRNTLGASDRTSTYHKLTTLRLSRTIVTATTASKTSTNAKDLSLGSNANMMIRTTRRNKVLSVLSAHHVRVTLSLLMILTTLITRIITRRQDINRSLTTVIILTIRNTRQIRLNTLTTLITRLINIIRGRLLGLLTVNQATLHVTRQIGRRARLKRVRTRTLMRLRRRSSTLNINDQVKDTRPLSTRLIRLTRTALLEALTTRRNLNMVDLGQHKTLKRRIILRSNTRRANYTLKAGNRTLLKLRLNVNTLNGSTLRINTTRRTRRLLTRSINQLTSAISGRICLLSHEHLSKLGAGQLRRTNHGLLRLLPNTRLNTSGITNSLHLLYLRKRAPFFYVTS